jgi:putative ABC transport system permease protein
MTADIRYALRLLARSPIFTITSVLSLAIGIAASSAIFSLADAFLLRERVGVTSPETLVDIGRSAQDGQGFDNFGYPLFATMRERSTLFTGLSAIQFGPTIMSLGDARSSERVFAGLVSGNYFEVIGTRPAAGRFFVADEDRTPDTHPVVVLSHAFWVRRFDARADVLGQTIRLNNRAYTVVGIAERGFTGTTIVGADFWVPMAMEQHVHASERSMLTQHRSVWMTAIGRLKPGATPRQARDELQSIMHAYLTEQGDDRVSRWGVNVTRSARVPPPAMMPIIGFIGLLGILTGLVLVIACSNVAGILLARAIERRREIATRLALGATRARILKQLLIEGLMLAFGAGVVSVPMAFLLVRLLASYQPSIPVPIPIELRIDLRVMAFAMVLSALSAVIFALLPGMRAARVQLAPALHGAHATADRTRTWLRHGLVVSQVAMSLLLLVVAGLFLRSLQQAASIDVGFNVHDVDTIHIDTRIGGYRTSEQGLRVVDALIERFRTVPGVTAVAASRMVPLQGGGMGLGDMHVPGHTGGPNGSDRIFADCDVVSADYFTALQLRIVSGRAFSASDTPTSPSVVIVNERFAAEAWPGQDPIGKQLKLEDDSATGKTLQVVGVARTAKYREVSDAPRNFYYLPLAQQFMSEVVFYARRSGSQSRVDDLRRAVVAYDPMLPVIHTETLEAATAIGLLPQLIAAWVAGSVGTIGLLLAAFGLYGLMAFSVAQRTREIAIRMALGSSREGVLWLVLRQAGRLALIGATIGLALAIGSSLLLRSLLIGLAPVDPLAFGAAVMALSGVTIVASLVPARRAARMDPMRALRAE